MVDLEALPPDPADNAAEMAGPTARRSVSRRTKLLMAAAGIASVTLGGFVAGVALTGGSSGVQLAETASATGAAGATGAPACAGPAAPVKGRGVGGTVATVDSKGTGFTVQAKSTTRTVNVDGTTAYQVVASAVADDLTPGTPVTIRGERNGTAGAAPNAAQIVILPAPTTGSAPTTRRPVSTITAASLTNGTGPVTVTTPAGTKTVNVTGSTKIYKVTTGAFGDLSPGQAVTVVGTPAAAPSTAIMAVRVIINEAGAKAPLGPFGFGSLGPAFRGAAGCTAPKAPLKRGVAAGTVSNLSGPTFSVARAWGPGGPVNVVTSSATVFSKQVQEAVSALKPGTKIMVRGTRSADGTTISASQIAVPEGPMPGAPAGAPAGPAGRAIGPALGTVTAVDAPTGTFLITTPDGQSLKVTTTPQVMVSITVPASLADVHNGDPVLVLGAPDASGAITATRVVIGTPGHAPLGRAGLFGPLGGGPFGGPHRRPLGGAPAAPGGGGATS